MTFDFTVLLFLVSVSVLVFHPSCLNLLLALHAKIAFFFAIDVFFSRPFFIIDS